MTTNNATRAQRSPGAQAGRFSAALGERSGCNEWLTCPHLLPDAVCTAATVTASAGWARARALAEFAGPAGEARHADVASRVMDDRRAARSTCARRVAFRRSCPAYLSPSSWSRSHCFGQRRSRARLCIRRYTPSSWSVLFASALYVLLMFPVGCRMLW